MSEKKTKSNNRQLFLNTFFTGTGYEEKQVNGWWLIKHKNGNNGTWEVAIYSPSAYKAMKGYQQGTSLFELQESHLEDIKQVAREEVDKSLPALFTGSI